MKIKILFFLGLFVANVFNVCAQTDSIYGRVLDRSPKPVVAATVVLQSQTDSTFLGGVLSDATGRFKFPAQNGPVKIIVSCLGYITSVRNILQDRMNLQSKVNRL